MDMEEGNRIDNAAVERYIMHGLPGCYNKIDRQNAIILVMGNKIFISSVVDEERAVHHYPRYDASSNQLLVEVIPLASNLHLLSRR